MSDYSDAKTTIAGYMVVPETDPDFLIALPTFTLSSADNT